jgi:hypothetical protein
MRRTLGILVLGVAVCSAAMLSASADDKKTEIKGGIEGKVKKVDADAKTLTITTEQGRDRTFTVTEDTTMVGPRGGKVRRRLKDPRFQEGITVTIVADGATATEIHLGFLHKEGEEKSTARDTEKSNKPGGTAPAERVIRKTPPARDTEPQPATKSAARTKAGTAPAEEDEEEEIPGKIKSFDHTRRVLVVTLLNGKDRSFMLAKDVKVLVKDTASKQGLEDPALKAGASVEVVTDEGGHKVKEVKVLPPVQRKKAG